MIDELRTSPVERGAHPRGSKCDADDRTTTWHFSVESEGDWLRIRLSERLDGLDHVVRVYDRPGFDYDENPCA